MGLRARTTHKVWFSASVGCDLGPSTRARTRTRANVNVRPRHLANEQANKRKTIWWRCMRVLHMSNKVLLHLRVLHSYFALLFRCYPVSSCVVCQRWCKRSFDFLKGVLEARQVRVANAALRFPCRLRGASCRWTTGGPPRSECEVEMVYHEARRGHAETFRSRQPFGRRLWLHGTRRQPD